MVNEIELLREMRSEVPEGMSVAEAERKLTERTAGGVRPARPLPRLRLGVSVAGACLLAVAAVAVLRPQQAPTVPQPSVAAQPSGTAHSSGTGQAGGTVAMLEQAALVADRSAALQIRPDQWFYVKESQHFDGADLPTFESWARMDGKRHALRTEDGELKFGKEKGPTHVGRTQQEVEALPSDPDALLAHFRGLDRELTPLSVCPLTCPPEIAEDVKVFGAIGWYMKFGAMIPPDTVAGMYRALAKLPQVSIEEGATDADGRPGIGVVFDAGDGVKAYYILDPEDYHYMGVKIVGSDNGTMGMSVLGAGIVDQAGDIP
ncbi:hypothetical protein GCM10009850_101920 [Nonomuraea monospora]|uniref:Uncharacterized protein n=1 Tax=Nonomuraea monospora TaxID=568818 RepID=A0ABP5PST5_9ACTN